MSVNSLDANLAYTDALKRASDAAKSGAADVETGATGTNFADLVRDAVENGINATKSAETISLQAAVGQAEIVDIVTAVSNAELTLQTVVAVRDRVVQAYQDIMRMPI